MSESPEVDEDEQLQLDQLEKQRLEDRLRDREKVYPEDDPDHQPKKLPEGFNHG
jgi:hypothetical protein